MAFSAVFRSRGRGCDHVSPPAPHGRLVPANVGTQNRPRRAPVATRELLGAITGGAWACRDDRSARERGPQSPLEFVFLDVEVGAGGGGRPHQAGNFAPLLVDLEFGEAFCVRRREAFFDQPLHPALVTLDIGIGPREDIVLDPSFDPLQDVCSWALTSDLRQHSRAGDAERRVRPATVAIEVGTWSTNLLNGLRGAAHMDRSIGIPAEILLIE